MLKIDKKSLVYYLLLVKAVLTVFIPVAFYLGDTLFDWFLYIEGIWFWIGKTVYCLCYLVVYWLIADKVYSKFTDKRKEIKKAVGFEILVSLAFGVISGIFWLSGIGGYLSFYCLSFQNPATILAPVYLFGSGDSYSAYILSYVVYVLLSPASVGFVLLFAKMKNLIKSSDK